MFFTQSSPATKAWRRELHVQRRLIFISAGSRTSTGNLNASQGTAGSEVVASVRRHAARGTGAALHMARWPRKAAGAKPTGQSAQLRQRLQQDLPLS